jgi:uncharacterized protein (UPF0333 family)
VSLQYLLGILAVVVLIASVGFFASYITIQVSQDTSRSSLQEVTEKVSSEIIDLVSLAYLNSNSTLTFKVIDIPDNINNKGYTVNIQNDSLGWKVVAYLDEYNTIRAESNLYFTSGIAVFKGTGMFYNVTYNWQPANLSKVTNLYSGTYLPVVWCQINQSIITVGFGRLVTG